MNFQHNIRGPAPLLRGYNLTIMTESTVSDDVLDCDSNYICKNDHTAFNEKDSSIKTYTWSLGRGSQQVIWSLSSRSNMSTMQRNSLSIHKRFSSSHNSLSDSTCKKVDDSMFITQAMSHDELDASKILDFYNVPLDSDIYSAPVDFVRNHYNIETVLHKQLVYRSGGPRNIEVQLKSYQTSPVQGNELERLTEISQQQQLTRLEIDPKRRTISNLAGGCNSKKNHFSFNLKQKLCSIFRMSKQHQYLRSKKTKRDIQPKQIDRIVKSRSENTCHSVNDTVSTRKLPPLPMTAITSIEERSYDNSVHKRRLFTNNDSNAMNFTASIDKVKECGWYWGPISSEGAEKILSNEPDGSFLVRDSSDDHYIFSLTFKLNGSIRHVRIDQDQGAFSFGSCAKFKSHTIMEFIDNAVEHSRSGRYLFFLHRRPEHGPLRVQLTKPVSRFKHVQSLQHLCRFIIHKTIIRKDLILMLPLPRRLLDYLDYKNCLSERVEIDMIG